MDEAGPSKSWDRSTSSSVRIQFPAEDGGPARSSAVENARFASIGLGPPPILRRPAAEQSATIHDRRRRVRSVDAAAIFSEPTQSARAAEGSSANARRRTLTQAHQGAASKAASGVRSEGASSDLGTLSDEYALAQEDPGILEDVQRALKLKARREARLRALQANVSRNEVPSKSDRTTISSVSAGSSISPIEVSFPTSTPPTSHVPGLSNESDIDFSPSVGVTHLHPVPTSSNDGATLDWSRAGPPGYKPEHRRWTLSLSKGKAKERTPSLGKGVVEKQDILYTQKLKRIREKARPNTIRKAAITSEQLQRRYNILYASLTSKAGPLNLAKVVGWYSSQEPIVRSTLDQVEPLTWLKHLLDKRGERASSRLPWHVTALIVEEYLKSQTHPDDIMSIGTSVTGSPVVDISQSSRDAKSLDISSPSSAVPLQPSFTRKPSFDGYVSFEPVVDPGREYTSVDSGQHRPDGYSRHWRHSLPSLMDTPRSSFSSILAASVKQSHAKGQLSPASSRGYLRDFGRRKTRHHFGSDGESSARASLSDTHPHSEGEPSREPRRPAVLSLHSGRDSGTDKGVIAISRASSEVGEDVFHDEEGALTAKGIAAEFRAESEPPPRPRYQPSRSLTERSSLPRIVVPPRRNMPSLTVHEQNFMRDEEQDEVNEELDRQEYERKAQMVEDAMAQNNRIRHLLQRVATGVKDYEYIRSHLSRLSDTEYGSLPQELVDAFSHDPAAVTGSTRRSKGWRAVEDVHNRLQRQNDILRSFIIQEKQDNKRSQTKSIFEDPISGLVDVLEKLEGHRQAIERKAGDVARMLTKVKPIHVQVKREYNQTLAHTSAVYDELSLIVRLEESYKDNYQQLWEFGMDALTFLLDTVTPFWRNYGKVIGEDVQDFLIIPWYRNEFTGEAKRYPIKRLPRRSFRHWLGLLLFSLSTLTITILQIRAAVYVSSLYRLPGINHTGLWWMVLPIYWTGFLIQWIAVLIECAIVGAQVAVVMWWVGWALNVFN